MNLQNQPACEGKASTDASHLGGGSAKPGLREMDGTEHSHLSRQRLVGRDPGLPEHWGSEKKNY